MRTHPSVHATRRSPRRGSALGLALLVLFALVAAGGSSVTLGLSRLAASRRAKDIERAGGLAEAGLHCALFELRTLQDGTGDGLGNVQGALLGGSYAAQISPAFTGTGTFTLRAQGTVGPVRRGVEAVVQRAHQGLAGFTGIESVILAGTTLDSYDSALGTYSDQVGALGVAGQQASLASNGDILLRGAACAIHGDATPGPQGSVQGQTSGVTGSIAPAAQLQSFEPFVYAPSLPSSGELTGSTSLADGSYRFDSVDLAAFDVLLLEGYVDLYVDGEISILGGAKLVIAPGAVVKLRHGSGDIHLGGHGVVNEAASPGAFQFSSASAGEIKIAGTSSFHGAVYAPLAEIRKLGNAELYGAAVGRRLQLMGGAVHHDLALAQSDASAIQIRYQRPYLPAPGSG
jgi:hypothetical protein